MSLKVLSESDILACMSVLTREAGDSSFLLPQGERVFERSRLFEVLNDVAFRVEDDNGSRSTNREREPEPEGRDLRGREATVAAESTDRIRRSGKVGLGRRLDAGEGQLKIARAELAKAKQAASSRGSRKRRRP